MSATEELRRMLTDAGVEYGGSDAVVYFEDKRGYKACAYDVPRRYGECVLCVSHTATPEQAIAATLGPAYEPPVAMHWNGDVLTLTIPRDQSCIRVQRSAEQPCKVYADESKAIAATLGNDGVGRTNDGLADLQAENAKLRELVDYMTPIALYAASEQERDRMRELGVEVNE